MIPSHQCKYIRVYDYTLDTKYLSNSCVNNSSVWPDTVICGRRLQIPQWPIIVLYTGQILDKFWWLLFSVIPCFRKIYGKREIYHTITNSNRPWQALTLRIVAICTVSYATCAWYCSALLHCVCIIISYWDCVGVIHSPNLGMWVKYVINTNTKHVRS